MTLRRSRAGQALGVLWRLAAGIALLLIFVGGTLLSLVTYANLPAGRRFVGFALQRVLASTFEGSFEIDSVDHVSLAELQASGITVHDPDGHVVLKVSTLSIQADLAAVAQKAWRGTGTVTLRFDHARIERAEVYLVPGKNNIPTIADAFTPSPSKATSGPATSGRKLKVWFPEIEVGHIYGRMALDGVPTLETELSTVRGSVQGAAELTAVDVERFSATVRGLGGADARGVGSVHVRAPGAVWTSFDGYFGDVQLGTVVRVDGPRLNITLDVPRAEPASTRALWAAYPLQSDVGAHVEADGTLHSLQTQAKLSIGRGSVDSSGELRLTDNPGADLDVSGRALDLRAIWPKAPQTALDADARVGVFRSGDEWVADVGGSTRATSILDVPVPALDLTGSYSAKGFVAHGTLHEPGAPLSVSLDLHPDGSLDGTAQATRVDLSRADRLQPYFHGHGVLDLQLKARIDKNHLVAQVNGELRELEYGQLTVKSSKISGRASGPLDAPKRLTVDLSLASKRLRAGAFGFDELDTKLSGPVMRPVISTTINNHHGPTITAQATVTPRSAPRLDDVSVEVRRDDAVLTAKAAQVEINGSTLRVNGLRLDGAGGQLEGSGELGPERLALVAHGKGLDLEVIAHALGLPHGLLSGKLALDADFESTTKTERGSFNVELDQARSDGVAIDSLGLSGSLSGSQLDLKSTAKLRDFGQFSAEAKATLSGSLADVRTLERVTGALTVKAEHVPFGLLTYALPKSAGVSEVRGEGSATLVLDREEPTAIPNVSLVANTNGLYVALVPKEKNGTSTVFDSVDAHAALNVNGSTGDSDLTFKLEDPHGALLSSTTQAKVDLATAVRHPEQLLAQLRATPLVAKAVIEDRPLENLPAPIVPKGVAGRLRTEVSLRGTIDHPIFSDKTELFQLRLGESERDKAIDVCAQLDYDKTTGQYGARGEVFLPTESARACKGSRVAQFSAGGRAEWDKVMSPALSADPAWTGTAGLSLEGMPLDVVPALAEAGIDGRVLGAVMFDRRAALPQMFAQLEVRDAVVERNRLGTAAIQARTDGRSLSATLKIDQPASASSAAGTPSGKLNADVQSSVNWQGVVPGIDDTRPVSAHLEATDVDAVILTPFLRDVLSDIGGKLDADLTANLTPDLNAKADQHWAGSVKGTLSMHDGTLQLAQLALRMRNVKFSATAEEHGGSTLIVVDSLSAAAEADKPNVAARGNIWLTGFKVVKGNANATLQGVPLLVEGVTLATLDGRNIGVELERRPTEMFVGLTIPELNAVLPQAAARSLISLSNNPSVEIAQPIAEPHDATDGESLPWRMKFDLGKRVKVTRQDIFLPISGSPQITLGDKLRIEGNIELTPGGRLNLPGLPRPFTIESGTVYFDADGEPGNPRVQVVAVCQLSQLTVRARVSGTFRKANITFESDDASLNAQGQAAIEAALLSAPSSDNSPAAAGIGAGAGYLGKQLLANTPLSNLELKAGSETTADQRSYSTYSAAYPITDELWFEGSYKTLQQQDISGANSNTNAFSGTFDWRFRRNWSLRTEVGNIGAGVDLL
ncbi:MAG TPA: hypothetical protein VIK01_18340, partial [Polyangiaceae bacterium]